MSGNAAALHVGVDLDQRIGDTQSRHDALIPTQVCLSRALACRDEVTSRHTEATGMLTTSLCLALGIDAAHSFWVGQAARLHDIGKLAAPWEMLHKPGKLSPEERSIIQLHASIGHDILYVQDHKFLMLAAEIALRHHERFDGSGYPDGLSGWQIPLEARIVAVVDVYEAMRTDRAYRAGMPHDRVVSTIVEGDGVSSPEQFDPEILRAFAREEATLAEAYELTQA